MTLHLGLAVGYFCWLIRVTLLLYPGGEYLILRRWWENLTIVQMKSHHNAFPEKTSFCNVMSHSNEKSCGPTSRHG